MLKYLQILSCLLFFLFLYGGIVVWVGGVLLPQALMTDWKVEVRWTFGLFSPISFVGTGRWQRENCGRT